MLVSFGYCASGQITISAKGGMNSTKIQLPSNVYWVDTKARLGWQTGLQVSNAWKHWLVYTGIGVSKNSFSAAGGPYSSVIKNPLFINMPVGAGYSLHISHNIALNLYSGLYGNLGAGGKLTEKMTPYCDLIGCPESVPSVYYNTRKINYGHTNTPQYSDDLYKANWGLQFGAGLRAFKRIELMVMYNLGINYITPYYLDDEKQKLRFFDFSIKYDIVTFKR